MELIRENDIEVRWREYFVQLLNGEKESVVRARRLLRSVAETVEKRFS